MLLPDLAELVALRGAAHGLSLRVRRPLLGHLQGAHVSARRGRGLEFEEVRPYAVGDDVRSIDWRVTARRGRPHTRLYREERERPVWLVADLHPGLFFASRRQFKSALLLRAAALLGWVAAHDGDRVGGIVVGADELRILPPRGREAGILPLLETLTQMQPRQPGPPESQIGSGLARLLPLLQPGSLVLLLSDYASIDPAFADALAASSRHNDVRLIHLTDPLEAAGLPAGLFRVGLPGRLWWLDGETSRDAWQRLWRERETRLQALADRLGVEVARLSTADDVADSLPLLLRNAA